MKTTFYTTFANLTKALDTVNPDELQRCPERFTQMVRQHDGMMARVTDNETISVAIGVNQGCVLASALFSLMFSALSMDTSREGPAGIDTKPRSDGNLFNVRRLKAFSKVAEDRVNDLVFAADRVLNTTTKGDLSRSVELFDFGCSNFSLAISTERTVVLHQPQTGADYTEPPIRVSGS
nr:unnamed protein product [Spirometra erinaceieuropaei]